MVTVLSLTILVRVFILVEEGVLLLLNHLELLLEVHLVLDLLLSSLLLVEGSAQIRKLYSNHEVEDEEGTKEDASDEEWVEAI